MKKITLLILTAIFGLSLAACDTINNQKNKKDGYWYKKEDDRYKKRKDDKNMHMQPKERQRRKW